MIGYIFISCCFLILCTIGCKPDDWNRLVIKAINDEVTTWLNEKKWSILKMN